jgi:probable rRNA maturation factor
MEIELIGRRSAVEIDHRNIAWWVEGCLTELKILLPVRKRKALCAAEQITVAFISRPKMQKLNLQFRHKNRPTDILSFSSTEKDSLGELALCLSVLKTQAREHELALDEEVGYMLIHGILHLLGYDHEQNKREAQKMFSLQDSVFKKLRKKSRNRNESEAYQRKMKWRISLR